MPLPLRDAMAAASALGIYRTRILPQVKAELTQWRGVAETIPDKVLRRHAVAIG